MTTLKSFQAEIERISHVKHAEAIKQAKEAHAAAELAKHHGKKKEPVVKEVIPEDEHDHFEEVPELPIEVSWRHFMTIARRTVGLIITGAGHPRGTCGRATVALSHSTA